jgi:membrane fusion protein (multidrug efflux system)
MANPNPPPAQAPPPVPAAAPKAAPAPGWRAHLLRYIVILIVVLGGGALTPKYLVPRVREMLSTVSTDDAYVNGHVTLVAPRVSGQVATVLVDDNYRVKRGDLLVQLDKEPYQIAQAIRQAAVKTAEAELVAAEAKVRATVAQARANRFQLEHAMEDVRSRIADLRASVATLRSRQATLALARNNLKRGEELAPSGGIGKEDLDQRRQTVKVDEAFVEQAREAVSAARVGLGLASEPPPGHELSEVPKDLEQDFSSVRQALGQLVESAAEFGYVPPKWESTPKEAIESFYSQDPEHNIDKILGQMIPKAPAIQQAKAKLEQARRDLDQANLDLRYCDVLSEIDGMVTRRNVNPGNNVQAGQSVMAVRSLTEIWVDANFKETQLADLRIGQKARLEVDMYGSRRTYWGRITGFTMGTGQTLALLPPQNATGNYVKIVQRLPVRIELTGYDPEKAPLFVGLSVVPYVYYKQRPTGPHAGAFLQPHRPQPLSEGRP